MDAAIACAGPAILAAGATADVLRQITTNGHTRRIDGRGRSLVPGFVDAHTHVVFAGDRREELRRRLAGATYAEIAASGGGILATVQATRAASADELAAATRARLAEMLAAGTTTCEAKSGYGLDTESELRMLRVIETLGTDQPVEIAFRLGISPRTVEIYRANLITKMEAASLSDLVRMALIAGILGAGSDSPRAS